MDYDTLTVEIMETILKTNSNCIDIGAHTGQFTDEMLRIAPQGVHYAFEPLPDLYQNLIRKYGDKINLFDIALSDKTGEVSFKHVVTNPGFSGFRERRYDRPNETVKDIIVKTNRLDAIVPVDTKIDFIKIDVEGAELQVLKGATSLLKKEQPLIVFEHGLGAADYYGTTPYDIWELLHDEIGLEINTLINYLNNEKSLKHEEFKSLYDNGEYYFMAY